MRQAGLSLFPKILLVAFVALVTIQQTWAIPLKREWLAEIENQDGEFGTISIQQIASNKNEVGAVGVEDVVASEINARAFERRDSHEQLKGSDKAPLLAYNKMVFKPQDHNLPKYIAASRRDNEARPKMSFIPRQHNLPTSDSTPAASLKERDARSFLTPPPGMMPKGGIFIKTPNPEVGQNESEKDENKKRDKPIPVQVKPSKDANSVFVQTPRVTLQDVKLLSVNRIEHSRSVAMPASPLKRGQMDALAMPPSPLKRGPTDEAMPASPLTKREKGAEHNTPPSTELNTDADVSERVKRMTRGPNENEAIHRRRPDDIFMRGPANKMNLAAAAASSADKDARRLSKRDSSQQDRQQDRSSSNPSANGDKSRSVTRTIASILEDGPTRWCLILILVSWSLIGVLSYMLLGPNARKSKASQAADVKTLNQVQSDKHKDAFDSIESALSKTSDSILDSAHSGGGQRAALHEHTQGRANLIKTAAGDVAHACGVHDDVLGEDDDEEAVVPEMQQHTEQTPLLPSMH
ncbi:hypothetical protein HDU77_004305 [Chytriomyces hyalinus]|nr:hypothetical protein HDU77_004305 [Chytriomyces hyalinus]